MSTLIEDVDYIKAKIVEGKNVKNEAISENKPAPPRLYLEFPLYGTHKETQGNKEVEVQNTYIVGVPDKRELEQMIETDTEYFNHYYRIWHKFLTETKRNQHYIIPRNIFRARTLIKAKVVDIYVVNVQCRGYDNREAEQNYDLNIGQYDRLRFRKERNDEGDWVTKGVDKRVPTYEFMLRQDDPESMKALEYWLEHSEGDIKFYCYPTLGGKPLEIIDFETFSQADFPDLMECGRRQITLENLRRRYRFYQDNPTLTATSKKTEK